MRHIFLHGDSSGCVSLVAFALVLDDGQRGGLGAMCLDEQKPGRSVRASRGCEPASEYFILRL